MSKELIPANLEARIYTIRGQKVMLDSDLAELYQVETKVLNQAVKRNSERFPTSFMFELLPEEEKVLRSQFVTSKNTDENKEQRGGRRYPAKVFTEHGVVMLANVLRSKRAITVSIHIVEAFVNLFLRFPGKGYIGHGLTPAMSDSDMHISKNGMFVDFRMWGLGSNGTESSVNQGVAIH